MHAKADGVTPPGSALGSRTAVFGLVAIPDAPASAICATAHRLVRRLTSCGWTEKGSGSGNRRESMA